MLTFLLVIQAIVGAVLVGVILMQQSEGGGLGMGGSPSGLMSARGAADFMTRATTILASVFVALSILHAVLATRTDPGAAIDTSLARKPVAEAPAVPAPETAPAVPLANEPVPSPRAETRGEPRPAPATERARVERAEPAAPPPAVTPTVTQAVPAASNAN